MATVSFIVQGTVPAGSILSDNIPLLELREQMQKAERHISLTEHSRTRANADNSDVIWRIRA
jgi:hypothetical protein